MAYLREQIQDALAHILSSDEFARSEQLRRLLHYLVEHSLGGRDYLLSEQAIAANVFGVHVGETGESAAMIHAELERVGVRLNRYYERHGADVPVRISFDPGNYHPRFSEPPRISSVRLGVAVLPFANHRGDPADEFLTGEIQEAIANGLSSDEGIWVAGRASLEQLQPRSEDLLEVGRRLRTSMAVRGTFQRDGDRLVVMVQLLNASNGELVWSYVYQSRIDDIVAMQHDIVADLMRLMGRPPGAIEQLSNVYRNTAKTAPEDRLLIAEAKYYFHLGSEAAIKKSLECFDEMTSQNPQAALAWAGVAACHIALVTYRWEDARAGWEKARSAAERALSLDADLPEVLSCAGFVAAIADFQPLLAQPQFERALQLDPRNEFIRLSYAALALVPTGKLTEAEEELEVVLATDPLNERALQVMGLVFYSGGRLREAADVLRSALELQPERALTHLMLGNVYDLAGERLLALESYGRWEQGTDFVGRGHWLQAVKHLYAGDVEAAEQACARISLFARLPFITAASMLADLLSRLGKHESALDWLERAFAERSYKALFLAIDPTFVSLREYPRFSAMRDRLLETARPEPKRTLSAGLLSAGKKIVPGWREAASGKGLEQE